MSFGLTPPHPLHRNAGVGQLVYNTSMRRCFDKSEAVDLASRRANETAMRKGGGEYAREERAIVQKGLMRFNRFEDLESSTAQDLKMDSYVGYPVADLVVAPALSNPLAGP